MCKYREGQICNITHSNCPWAYWCGHISAFKERESCKKYCKLLKEEEQKVPEGHYKVKFERHGFLYIDFNNQILKIKNPFEDVPSFVKIKKYKTSYKLAK